MAASWSIRALPPLSGGRQTRLSARSRPPHQYHERRASPGAGIFKEAAPGADRSIGNQSRARVEVDMHGGTAGWARGRVAATGLASTTTSVGTPVRAAI